MARNGIEGEAAESILLAITSFALYGFPESHAASFALIVYASAYLKVYFPAAFYTAMLNNQPMGFYHPATLVKDAQRHGVRFAPIDVQQSGWDCRVDNDGAIRLGLRYVQGLREDVGRAIERQSSPAASSHDSRQPEAVLPQPGAWGPGPALCPKCGNDDERMIERDQSDGTSFCNLCAHAFTEHEMRSARVAKESQVRFASLEHLIAAAGVRRDELATLAGVGALNAFGYNRRDALWQIERAIRPAGELFDPGASGHGAPSDPAAPPAAEAPSPLAAMTPIERVIADYEGTGLTIGPHPMALRRAEMSLRGVLRAAELPRSRSGRRVRVAGAVITRQRPGTAKGFVFLTLEDETGIANIIVRPDLFDVYRVAIIEEPFLLVEGVLQQQDKVTSIRAERVLGIGGARPEIASHDFH
jgi:error-prone DNA polymerase